MNFAVINNAADPRGLEIANQITDSFVSHGHKISKAENGIQFAFNLTNIRKPQIFRRKSKAVFVVSLVVANKSEKNLRALCYTTLIRSLSNLLLCIVHSDNGYPDQPEIYFTTPEAGFYHLPFDSSKVYKQILPIAGSHFAIDNHLIPDLPERCWVTSPIIKSIREYSKELDKLGVLPTPFPLREVLPQKDIEQLYQLFQMKGLSYGNLSARESFDEFPGNPTFWMTARGIDKANIKTVGKDLLLVRGINESTNTMLVSVPPQHDEKARVSVDAVEHFLIYKTFPEVNAIVHVHAWMDGILCTKQNYPCGTRELAEEVVDLLKRADNPSQAVVGLKNHGLTITGHSLPEIFSRIRGKLQKEVAMFV